MTRHRPAHVDQVLRGVDLLDAQVQLSHARVARVVFGTRDPKKLVLKNQVATEGGVLAEECGAILSRFFASRR